MKRRISKVVATVAASLLMAFGIAEPAAASAPPASLSAPISGSSIPLPRGGGASVNVTLGPWVTYASGPYKSLSTCENARRYLQGVYGGTHYGAWGDSRCGYVAIPTCPPRVEIRIQVRYVTGVGGGGGGGWAIDPQSSSPSAVCAA